ncbi:hypothetical protein MMC08_005185 [Hypocenomyce scalaris]|nr:hypothetical protein [Hypocenomyce scalaris]
MDTASRVFIAGDGAHKHSAEAAQGIIDVSMHDSCLAWKIKLAVQGIAKPALLPAYEHERRKIVSDLIASNYEHNLIPFDYWHANASLPAMTRLYQRISRKIRFIAGVGAEYAPNAVNLPGNRAKGGLRPRALLLPARVTRYINANSVDIQLDIPMLGNFRMYFLTRSFTATKTFLNAVYALISAPTSLLSRVSAAAAASTPETIPTETDEFVQP